jgi:prolyl-tRNA synthetase
MRTREFIMKDLYSFSKNEDEHLEFYEKAKQAYTEIFKRVGIGDKTYFTLASGGSFSEFSHEFQTVTDSGEDIIYIHENGTVINKEIFTKETKENLGLDDNFTEVKSVEVGNIFTLGTKYSDTLGLAYKNDSGEDVSVFMGSYGIGLGRLMGTVVEVLSDEKGIVWPASIAPFGVHLISMTSNDEVVVAYADALYDELTAAGVEVLYDDREARAGEKLADADLIGIPTRILIGKDTISSGAVEVVDRANGEVKKVTRGELLSHMGSLAAI